MDYFIQGERFINFDNNINIFYRNTHDVNIFFIDKCKQIKEPFILISHNSDGNIVDSNKTFLRWCDANVNLIPPNLVKWFGQNVNYCHEKIESIPIGLENDKWFPLLNKKQKIFSKKQELKNIRNLLYINHNIENNVSERTLPYSLFGSKNWCTKVFGKNGVGFDDYIDNVYNHHFVICPDGNGIDTHRLWECLYLNCIPIVKKGINVNFYKDLPICFINEWSDISESFLNHELNRINNCTWNMNKINFYYWEKRIKSFEEVI